MNQSWTRFYKMSGSGNDFVFFLGGNGGTPSPEEIRRVCARGTGVGADGLAILRKDRGSLALKYFNSDGSVGELCGNATLCAIRLAVRENLGQAESLAISTDSGRVTGRLRDGSPEIDLAPAREIRPELSEIPLQGGEHRIGFARLGVPHVVVLVDDVSVAHVGDRGRRIRRNPALRDGANVNFLSAGKAGSWRIRTYERGVEGETLACGTGAVASGLLLVEWGLASSPVTLTTRSGKELTVAIKKQNELHIPSLRGPAELVFVGELSDPIDGGRVAL